MCLVELHTVQVSFPPHLCATAIAEGLREPTKLPGAVPVWQDRVGALPGRHHWAVSPAAAKPCALLPLLPSTAVSACIIREERQVFICAGMRNSTSIMSLRLVEAMHGRGAGHVGLAGDVVHGEEPERGSAAAHRAH